MVGPGTRLDEVVGGKTADALDKALDLRTVGDLVRHYPRRYAERGELTDLADLRIGDEVTVLAEVRSVTRRPMRQRRGTLLEAVVGDGRRTLKLTFFGSDPAVPASGSTSKTSSTGTCDARASMHLDMARICSATASRRAW